MIGKTITTEELMKKKNNMPKNSYSSAEANYFKNLLKTADGRCSAAYPYWGTVLKSVYRMDEHFSWIIPNFGKRTIDFNTGQNIKWDIDMIKDKLSMYSEYTNYYFEKRSVTKETVKLKGKYDIIIAYSEEQFYKNANISLSIDNENIKNIVIQPQPKVTWNKKRKRGYSKVYYIILNNVDINNYVDINISIAYQCIDGLYITFAKIGDKPMDAIKFPTLEMPNSVKNNLYSNERIERIETEKQLKKDAGNSYNEEEHTWEDKFKICIDEYPSVYNRSFIDFISYLKDEDEDEDERDMEIMDFIENYNNIYSIDYSWSELMGSIKQFKKDYNIKIDSGLC